MPFTNMNSQSDFPSLHAALAVQPQLYCSDDPNLGASVLMDDSTPTLSRRLLTCPARVLFTTSPTSGNETIYISLFATTTSDQYAQVPVGDALVFDFVAWYTNLYSRVSPCVPYCSQINPGNFSPLIILFSLTHTTLSLSLVYC
jgi:hypothetical protein